MEAACGRAFRVPINVNGASRTDSGVHALGQVAAIDVETTIPVDRMSAAINRHLPEDVAVWHVEPVSADFHPIRGAVSKVYRYTIYNGEIRPVFGRKRCHHFWHRLDETVMHCAAQVLVGEHDFESFANAHHGRDSAVRTVHWCDVEREGEYVFVTICGGGFLYHMVRIIAGTLEEVGRGSWSVDDVARILEARNRDEAGPTVVAAGLCLHRISYDRVLGREDV